MLGGGGGIDDRRSFRIEYCRVKTFCLREWTEYFLFPFWNFRYSISFRLRLLLLLLFFFLFQEEDEIFIVEFDTFFFFLFLDSFPPRFGGMQSVMVSYVLDWWIGFCVKCIWSGVIDFLKFCVIGFESWGGGNGII